MSQELYFKVRVSKKHGDCFSRGNGQNNKQQIDQKLEMELKVKLLIRLKDIFYLKIETRVRLRLSKKTTY